MASVSAPHHEKCPYCASESVDLEWRDPIDAQKFQYLWHCENCNHEFTTVAASDEADPSMTEITQAFFTSLLV